jgi:ABC-type multidrug transport system fused ATPase/permease subunit
LRAAVYDSLLFSLTRAFSVFTNAISFLYGVYLVREALAETNEVYACASFLNIGAEVLITYSVYLNDFLKAAPATDSLFELIEAEPGVRDGTGDSSSSNRTSEKGSLLLEHCSFAYPSRLDQLVIDDLSLSATQGQMVALVGPSGGGKSTVVQLIERFYESQLGRIEVNGVPVGEMKLR